MPEVVGQPRKFHTKFKFQISIDKVGTATFQSCSELKADVAKIEYYEGGMIIPYKEPGRLSFPDLTIQRAVTQSSDFYKWIVQVADAAKNGGAIQKDPTQPASYKSQATIIQLDRDNTRLRTWNIANCWPLSYTAGAWDNSADELTMEQIVLAYDYFDIGTNVTAGSGVSG